MRWLLMLLALFGPVGCGAADTPATQAAMQAGRAAAPAGPSAPRYPWLTGPPAPAATVAARFPPPPGCQRVAVAPGSWGAWLRGLPLRPPGTPARLFDGRPKNRQDVVAAVVDIDVGRQDLQQCADAVIRLRAEYLFSIDPNEVHFHLTTGYDFWFSDFVAGKTFRVSGNEVLPAPRPPEASSHAALGRYLLPTFGYAGTLSLRRELRPVPLAAARPGDVLIHGGSPGHAVLVLDVAVRPASGQRYLLLAQSYMPAQSIHLLQNIDAEQSALRNRAWFAVPGPEASQFDTPEWTFEANELARF